LCTFMLVDPVDRQQVDNAFLMPRDRCSWTWSKTAEDSAHIALSGPKSL
jgi:hypothetical protein